MYLLGTRQLILPVLLLWVAGAQAASLVLRDGSRLTGTLTMCDEEYCVLDSKRVGLETVALIELIAGAGVPRGAGAGAVVLADGTIHPGRFSGLNLGYVGAADEEIDRETVALIVIAPLKAFPPDPTVPHRPPEAVAEPAPPSRSSLVLNEIRFSGSVTEPPFIELLNPTETEISLAGFAVRNKAGQQIELPHDGRVGAREPFLVPLENHRTFLEPGKGQVVLLHDDGAVDVAAWGMERPDHVRLCLGGRCSDPPAGSVIARVPGRTRPGASIDWALLDPGQATPNAPNQRPRVSMFAGIPGMIVTKRPDFSWYGVPGAARYRVQVGTDEKLTNVIWEQTADATKVPTLVQEILPGPELSPGSYFWGVQAIGSDGEASEFSRAMSFTVAAQRSSGNDAFVRVAYRVPEEDEPPVVGNELPVVAHKQRKDTRMLMLEAVSEKNPRGWDIPDPESVRPYCARAAVINVARFYGARLSLDRVGYEGFRKEREGPELDLPETGMTDAQTTTALQYALGTTVQYHPNPGMRDADRERNYDVGRCDLWQRQNHPRCGLPGEGDCPACPPAIAWAFGTTMIDHIKREIDAGRPIVATSPGHVFVIAGYKTQGDGFAFLWLDEVFGSRYIVTDGSGLASRIDSYWTGLRAGNLARQEPEIDRDTDGDGVVDFDETMRFTTKAHDPDTDDDSVPDKEEIRATVFDPEHGYARSRADSDFDLSIITASLDFTARDKDRDGKAMELDQDSDGGGCRDGDEDFNADGRYDADETSNFVPGDDVVDDEGECGKLWTGTIESTHYPYPDHRIKISVRARLREKKMRLPRAAVVGAVQATELYSVGSVVTNVHSTAGPPCTYSGESTSPANHLAGNIIWTVESVGPDGKIRWSKPVYNFSITPDNDMPWFASCPPQSWTHEGGWGAHVGDAHDADGHLRTVEGGRMQGRYDNEKERTSAEWNLCRGGGNCIELPDPPASSTVLGVPPR